MAQKPSRARITAQTSGSQGWCMHGEENPSSRKDHEAQSWAGCSLGQPLLLLGLQSSMSVSQLRPEKPVRQAQR